VLALAILLGLVAGSVFLGLAWLAPQAVLGIYSKDQQVVALGSDYLRIFGWAYFIFPITFSFAMVMRSIGDVKTPMLVSVGALAFNALLSYFLIFGKLGLPVLGVRGAAIAALLARLLECGVLLLIVYRRRSPIALHLKDLFGLDLSFVGRVFMPMLPVILNETFWSFGTTAYSVVYARIGTDSIAAMNIVAARPPICSPIFAAWSAVTPVTSARTRTSWSESASAVSRVTSTRSGRIRFGAPSLASFGFKALRR